MAYKFQDGGTDKREILGKVAPTTVDTIATNANATPTGATAMNCLAAIALSAAALF